MARKTRTSETLSQLECCLQPLNLESVPSEAWNLLRNAESTFSLDVQVNIDHVCLKDLSALSKVLQSSKSDAGSELWVWLSAPAGSGHRTGLSRVKALLVLLGQTCGNSSDLVTVSAGVYLELLSVEGADQQWSLLFQPAIFRVLLHALQVLRRKQLTGRKEKSVDEDVEMQVVPADDGEDDSELAGKVSIPEAVSLLQRLQEFLQHASLPADTMSRAVDELSGLMLKPVSDIVGRQAAAGISAIVSRAGGKDDVRKAAAMALRATMPALMMVQERGTPAPGGVPKPLLQARSNAIAFMIGLIQREPSLLDPQQFTAELDQEPDEEEPSETRKRRRVGEGEEEEKGNRRRKPRGCGTDDPIVAMLELVCVLTPDRSEWRGYAAEGIIAILSEACATERKVDMERGGTAVGVEAVPALPIDEKAGQDAECQGVLVPADGSVPETVPRGAPNAAERFLLFLERLLESERVACRVLATDIAVSALERSGQLARCNSEEARAILVQKMLVTLVRRCADAVASVRSRALGGVSSGLQYLGKSDNGTRLLRELVLERGHAQHINLAKIFRVAAIDEKPTVRRAALSFFDSMMPLLRSPLCLEGENLSNFFDTRLIANLSADESISVRKASVGSLALLLRTCPTPKVSSMWVDNVLPLILDVEASVGERALDELEVAVLNPLSELTETRKAADRADIIGGLPSVLDRLDSEAAEYLQRGLRCLAKRNEGKLPPRFVKSVICTVKQCMTPLPISEWPLAIWLMLEEIVTIDCTGVKFDLILDAWILFSSPAEINISEDGVQESKPGLGGLHCSSSHQEMIGARVLRVLESMIPDAPHERLPQLMSSLSAALSSLTAPTTMICAMMCVIQRMEEAWKAKKTFTSKAAAQTAWKNSFLKSIQATLAEYVRPDSVKQVVDSRCLSACLFSLGELAIIDSSLVSDGIVMQVQTIATNTAYRNGERIETDSVTRGHAFSTLGKFCLKKDVLAKKSMELLVLHLAGNESFVVRNNVLIVLGDLCIHYTSLVDRFVPYMTDLLRDPNELLRKQAAMILASLLSEDFIKFRGSILLRFLTVLSDTSDSVRNFVECVFVRILHQRNQSMFSHNFLDVICALNGWAALPSFQGIVGNEEFSLQKSPARRALIYRFMLANMTNDQKFNVCAQIVTTLLAQFVDAEEKIPLPSSLGEPAGQVLSDGLSLLCCKEMRICFTTQKANQEEPEADAAPTDKAGAEAARGVLSSILKRIMCENIVPVLVQLKNRMESRRSPFLGQLRHCLREILRDFKDDLKLVLAGDPQLATEIAFELQEQPTSQPEGIAKAVSTTPCHGQGAAGACRRVSLGSMMKMPLCDMTPIADAPKSVDPASPRSIPQPRRSAASPLIVSVDRAKATDEKQKSLFSAEKMVASPCSAKRSVDSTTRGPVPRGASPEPAKKQRRTSPPGSPRHVPSLPVITGRSAKANANKADDATQQRTRSRKPAPATSTRKELVTGSTPRSS
mmetsp:Transcript_34280/g.91572  ORF Transcript_34280/g.91572 Transcript_34280/m.91572 type:complete len:1485 (-) Transcript_34280:299-4753(-)